MTCPSCGAHPALPWTHCRCTVEEQEAAFRAERELREQREQQREQRQVGESPCTHG